MAWPPPVLPINRTNADPQQDTHPNDHNSLALAMNDTVTEVQRVDSVVKALQSNHRTAIMAITTDLNGEAWIPWTSPTAAPFTNTVFAVVTQDLSGGVMDSVALIFKVPSTAVELGRFLVRVYLHDGQIVVTNGSITVGYYASGY